MIVLSVFAEEYAAARAALDRYGRAIDLVELRLDTADERLMDAAIAAVRHPVILTVRSPDHGGRYPAMESERLAFMRSALARRPFYLDVEYGTAAADLIAEFPGQPMILSCHPEKSEVEQWLDFIRRGLALNPAVFKFVPPARYWRDNLAILSALESAQTGNRQSLACFCSGEIGLYSRALAPAFGSFLAYCATPGAEPTAAGQMTAAEAIDLYRLPRLNRTTAVYGIAGNPIAHSLSPRVHNTLFARHRLDAVYLPFRVVDFEEFITFARAADIAGLSVTTPHKQAAFASVSMADDAARRIGATNTLIRSGTEYAAHMFDGVALAESIAARLGSLEGVSILVLGPGGAGRAAARAFANAGACVALCGRSVASTKQAAAACEVAAITREKASAASWKVTVNATPMASVTDDTDGFLERLAPSTGLAVDLHYTPSVTRFLELSAQRGCATLDGMDLFARQAARQFALFTGITTTHLEILQIIGEWR